MNEKNLHNKKFRFTLANKITLLRIVMIPVTLICLLKQLYPAFYALFAFAVLTDLLDGLAARLRKEQTLLGAFIDPMADKLLLTSVYMALVHLGLIDVWVFVVVFSRDLLIVLGWSVIYILTRSFVIEPRILGKTTTAVQMFAALFFTIPQLDATLHKILLTAIVVLTSVSIVDYIFVGERRLGQWES